MKIIFDEDIPRELTPFFGTGGHEAVHVEDFGWKGITNGDLLQRISGAYDALITDDTNMRRQQNWLSSTSPSFSFTRGPRSLSSS